ncbi:MAG: nitroreductase family protein [Bacteroidales bacterium]|nr:nitroreductase family protein [Bacteroidales bacterium]
MFIKSLLKKVLSYKLFYFLQKINFIRITYKAFKYDAKRYLKHSNAFFPFNTKGKLLGQIIAEYHAIEKGICMPERRIGFGQKLMSNLIDHCLLFVQNYGTNDENFIHAVKVIAEYDLLHKAYPDKLDSTLEKKIEKFLSNFPYDASSQLQMTREEYLKYNNAPFDKFSQSRHSLRNFSGNVDENILFQAIQLAQTAPSSCNRQPSRVYIINEKEKIAQALALQNGNRGFGHLADKLLIITEDLNYFLSISERNEAYINGGMFSLNLLYALHFYGIGACPLNWCAEQENDMGLRKLCSIPENEIVILLIAIGGIPEKFMLASSPRVHTHTIIKKI